MIAVLNPRVFDVGCVMEIWLTGQQHETVLHPGVALNVPTHVGGMPTVVVLVIVVEERLVVLL